MAAIEGFVSDLPPASREGVTVDLADSCDSFRVCLW